MENNIAKSTITEFLLSAGIHVNGNQNFDIQVHNEEFYSRVLRDGILGLGESYMDAWWDCNRVDEFVTRLYRGDLVRKFKSKNKLLLIKLAFEKWMLKLINLQTKIRALQVGRKHYDLGNVLFQSMLDSRMNYSCGYWKNANQLEGAQLAKLE